ncbi:MAG TPA: hypothetical protein VF266_09690 [Thermoanaerobaculia bacterium]
MVRFQLVNTTPVSNLVVVVVPDLGDIPPSAILSEWRVLTPAAGGSSAFRFGGAIQAIVSDGRTSTAPTAAPLGSLLPVTTAPNGGLLFGARVSGNDPSVAAVRNDSTDDKLLTVRWRVDGAKVLTQHGLNQKAVANLALTRTLQFFTRDLAAGLAALDFPGIVSQITSYTIPDAVTSVKVTWSRDSAAGADTFTFAAR